MRPCKPSRPKPNLPKRERRRFQFSLRTLLVGVTLVGIVGGYLASQTEIVSERRQLLRHLVEFGGGYYANQQFSGAHPRPHDVLSPPGIAPRRPPPSVSSVVRKLLGDCDIDFIWLPNETAQADSLRIAELFPEADIFKNMTKR